MALVLVVGRGRGSGSRGCLLNTCVTHVVSFTEKLFFYLDVSCVQWVYVCVRLSVCCSIFFGILLRRDPLPAVYERRWIEQQYFGYLFPLAHTLPTARRKMATGYR